MQHFLSALHRMHSLESPLKAGLQAEFLSPRLPHKPHHKELKGSSAMLLTARENRNK